MNSGFILGFTVFATLLLSFADGSHPIIQSSIGVTADVPTRIQHISRATDQSSGGAKNTFVRTMPPYTERNNSTKNGTLDAIAKKTNSTGPTLDSVTVKAVVRHIPRSKRRVLYDPIAPFDFYTTHQPCEFDVMTSSVGFSYLWGHPEHCRWILNARFVSEPYFRAYMLSMAEGFFFGQYSERLRRYETDPHVYAYPDYQAG